MNFRNVDLHTWSRQLMINARIAGLAYESVTETPDGKRRLNLRARNGRLYSYDTYDELADHLDEILTDQDAETDF